MYQLQYKVSWFCHSLWLGHLDSYPLILLVLFCHHTKSFLLIFIKCVPLVAPLFCAAGEGQICENWIYEYIKLFKTTTHWVLDNWSIKLSHDSVGNSVITTQLINYTSSSHTCVYYYKFYIYTEPSAVMGVAVVFHMYRSGHKISQIMFKVILISWGRLKVHNHLIKSYLLWWQTPGIYQASVVLI